MTYEEAMKILHPSTTLTALAEVEYYGGFNGQEAKIKAVEEACLIACKALEKQIPKKPNDKFNVPHYVLAYGICPSCGLGVNSDMKFCSECGQAIDWEVSE